MSTDMVNILVEVMKKLDICAARQENQRIHENFVHSGCVGRTSYDIGEDLLLRFLEAGFSCKDITDNLGVCTKTVFRRLRTFNLRVTNSKFPGSLALMYIDGRHKLMRWGFVIHGGLDGFSRKIMHLRCHTNNKASSVFNLFQNSIQKFGLPSRVRADKGVENVEVARFMLFYPLKGPD